jgi:hypothetical protein
MSSAFRGGAPLLVLSFSGLNDDGRFPISRVACRRLSCCLAGLFSFWTVSGKSTDLSCLSAGNPLVLACKGKNAGIVLSFSGLTLPNFIVSTAHLAGRERQTQIRGRSAAGRASRSEFSWDAPSRARNRVGLKLPSPAALIRRWLPICPSSSLAGNLKLSSRLAGLINRMRGEADELSSDLAGDLIKLNASSLVTSPMNKGNCHSFQR